MTDFSVKLNNYISVIEDALTKHLPNPKDCIVSEAMTYSVTGGGKRLRPVFLLASAEAFGGAFDMALPFAAAIEMIHAYSLIHDDLPAMDDDDYRRGRLSCHKKFGEAYAILAGDGLLNRAYEVMLNAIGGCETGDAIKRLSEAAGIIANASGINGMIAGQTADIQSSGFDEQSLVYINERKTGALISAAFRAGATIGGADARGSKLFGEAGMKTGIAFQIRDDILDYEGSFEALGKLTGSDEKNNKTTYATIWGAEECAAKIKRLSDEASDLLKAAGAEADFLITMIYRLINRSS